MKQVEDEAEITSAWDTSEFEDYGNNDDSNSVDVFFEDISSSLMCIPPDKTSMFSKQESLISSSDCWICAWTCVGPIPKLGLIPSWIIGYEKLHRNVRPHWNLESLLSICYWRTTANGHFSSSHFLNISRKYVSLQFGRWSLRYKVLRLQLEIRWWQHFRFEDFLSVAAVVSKLTLLLIETRKNIWKIVK